MTYIKVITVDKTRPERISVGSFSQLNSSGINNLREATSHKLGQK